MTNEPRANALSVLYSSRSIGKDLGSLYGSFEFENKNVVITHFCVEFVAENDII